MLERKVATEHHAVRATIEYNHSLLHTKSKSVTAGQKTMESQTKNVCSGDLKRLGIKRDSGEDARDSYFGQLLDITGGDVRNIALTRHQDNHVY